MPEGHARLHAFLVVGFAEAARVRQLKTNHQIVGRAVALLMRANEYFADLGQILFVLFDDDELIRIGSAVGTDRHSFSAVNQLRSAFAKALPATPDFLGRAARGCSIPAFHGMNRPAI